jgi:D-glycero-alpha-D-manno-heptose 1-phosphate guanylyltransferase
MPRAEEAIVLVGGLGTRLRAVVADLPKPLAPVAGRPFLAYLLDHLAQGGLRRVILATGYLAEKIEQAVGRQWQGMEIVYSHEAHPLGTGGAVALAARQLQRHGVHLVNGDTFLRYDLAALEYAAEAQQLSLSMALAHVTDVARYGAVEVAHGRVQAFCEKGGQGPGWINAGSYYLTGDALDRLSMGRGPFSFETDLLLPLATAGQVGVLQATTDFIDIGVPEDYARAQSLFAAHG